MLLARWLVLALLVSGIVYLALSIVTGERRYRVIGTRLIKWTMVAGLVFFGVLIFERVTEML